MGSTKEKKMFYLETLKRKTLSIYSDKCKKVYVSLYEVIFDRNGAKAYVKNLRVLSERKIREKWFNEIFWSLQHSKFNPF